MRTDAQPDELLVRFPTRGDDGRTPPSPATLAATIRPVDRELQCLSEGAGGTLPARNRDSSWAGGPGL